MTSGRRWHTGRESRDRRRGHARSPWRRARGRARARSVRGRARAHWRRGPAEPGWIRPPARVRVGGHFFGRICGRVAPPPGRPHGEPDGLEVGAGGLAPHARRLLDAPERPAQPPKCQNFPSFVVAQDVGYAGERNPSPSRRVNVLSAYPLWPVLRCRSMAGFGCRPRPGRRGFACSGRAEVTICRRSCGYASRRDITVSPKSFPFELSDLSWLAQGKSPAFQGARLGVFDRGSMPARFSSASQIVQEARRGVRRGLRPRPPSRAEVGSARHEVSPLPARKRGGCEVLRGVRCASCPDLRQLRPAAHPDGEVLS